MREVAGRSFDVFQDDCPSRDLLDHVTSRWGALTLAALRTGPVRFGELRRSVDGVSDKMLSQTLKTLQGDGLVDRRVLSQVPPHVEYRLTGPGREIADAVTTLIGSIYTVLPDVMLARERG